MNELTPEYVNSLIRNEKYSQIVSLYTRKDPDSIKRFKTIEINQKQYTVNQDVAVCALNDDIYSGKLIKITNIKDPDNSYIPMVQIQWYYSKQDLKIEEKYLTSISDKELFFSTHTEYLPANKLQCGIQVLSFEEYCKLEFEEETTFFTRATIDLVSMEPQPSIKMWHKSCICKLPQNPDLQMIYCESCDDWFHLQCVNVSPQDVDKIDDYKCPGCA